MNKTKFLAVLAIPALLAACSQDEFTEIATNQGVDLSNRKVLENVTLNFGDTDVLTRGTIGSSSYNSYKWTSEDGVGACIIDAPDGNGGYDFTDYISSNYKYYYTADSQWKTDALMVEGNYMFYSPYSEKHLVRSNIVAEVPTTQNVLVKTDDNNPIKEFYESGNTVFIGYKFLPAKDQPKVIDVAMRHIFAYPKFTLTNLYDTRTTAEIVAGKPAVYPDIKIVKIVLKTRGDEFKVGFEANNANVAGSLKAADNGEGLAWDAVKHSTAATTDVLDVAKDGNGNDITAKEITINLGEGITLKGEESLSFHAVLPAAAYNDGIEAVAYDEKGNTYTVNSKIPRTGVTLNPGYRYPAQEYNNDGSLKKSAGELLTFKLTDKNAAPTDILDNDDFIAYLKSLSVRFNELNQIAGNATAQNESEFKLNDNAAIVINTTLIDALANFNSTEGGITDGKVTFNNEAAGATFAIGSDVTIKSAAYANDAVTLEVVSVNGAEYTVVLPAANTMAAAAGTYVISSGTVDVDANQAAPTNIIITGSSVEYAGVNAKKISSLTVAEDGELTLTGKTEGVQINVSEGATLKINANVLVTGKIVNNGTIENSGTMYAETNVNNGTITVAAANSVTKAAAGKGTIVNTNLGAVKANAAQTVTWEGEISALNVEKTGLAVAGNAKYGINNVTITDTDLSTGVTLALLKAPIKGCTVSTVTLSAATKLTLAEGGDLGGLTLVFDKSCTWTGDNFNAPTFTNATLRIADGQTVSVSYATVSGKLDKNVTGYKAGKIEATDATGEVNF